jgi:hypothetical protein
LKSAGEQVAALWQSLVADPATKTEYDAIQLDSVARTRSAVSNQKRGQPKLASKPSQITVAEKSQPSEDDPRNPKNQSQTKASQKENKRSLSNFDPQKISPIQKLSTQIQDEKSHDISALVRNNTGSAKPPIQTSQVLNSPRN